MDPKKMQFMRAVLGRDGAEALSKAVTRTQELEHVLLPRTILAWLEVASRWDYEGEVPGVENTYLSFRKDEDGYTGSIKLDDGDYVFARASLAHVAASIAVALGADHERIAKSVRDIDLARIGKSIDLLAKAKVATDALSKMKREPQGEWKTTPETIAQQHSGGWKSRYPTVELRQMPISSLDWIDFRKEPDARGLGVEYIKRLAEKMKTGVPLPPAIGYENRLVNGKTTIVAHDGNHRIAAAKILGHRTVPILVSTKQLSLPLDKGERGVEPATTRELDKAQEGPGKAAKPIKPVEPAEGTKGSFQVGTKPAQSKTPPHVDVPVGTPKPPKVTRTIKSLHVTKSESESACQVCTAKQFRAGAFTGCMCFRALAKSVNVVSDASGYTLEFKSGWDAESIITLAESFKQR